MIFKIKQERKGKLEKLYLILGVIETELKGITSTELGIDALLNTQERKETDLIDDNLKKKARKALIKSADKTQLESIFSQPGFLSNCNQALSNIITEKTIDIVLKRKTIQALHKISDTDEKNIAKIMKEAVEVTDKDTQNEAISFFKTYHKNVNENLITFLVKESKLEEEFKKDLYTNKTEMEVLNNLLNKFDNQESIDYCLQKAKKYLVLIGHDNFNEKKPGIDLFYKVPTNIKELTKQN